MSQDATSHRVLLVAHPRRQEVRDAAAVMADRLNAAGWTLVLDGQEAHTMGMEHHPGVAIAPTDQPVDGCELVVVLGGDGTFLRAAETVRGSDVPLLGINLGHVGFLAEAEREELDATVGHITRREYRVEERLALDVTASIEEHVFHRGWALNEVSVEKAARERMLELTVAIDSHPVSTWGCDGVVLATPTGSTAYAFSAGGPIVWPDVDAMLVVPISAHALFARPLVVGPDAHLAVDVVAGTRGVGVLWADGRRSTDLPPGARIEVGRSATPVRLARLTESPFADRLVAKFNLSIHGWRGDARRARAQEPR